MRVLLVTGSLPPRPCGVGDYTSALATALARVPGVEVSVLTASTTVFGPGVPEGWRALPPLRSWRLGQAGAFLRILGRLRPDVVHLQYPTQGYGGAWLPSFVPLLAWMSGAAVVRTWHEWFNRSGAFHLLAQSAAPGPSIIVRPDFEQLLWPPLRPLVKWRRRVWIRGASSIPPSRLSAPERAAKRAALLDGASRLILFFGFLYPGKGAERLFDVADPRTDRLIFAGEAGADRAYADDVARRASSPPWVGRARLTGFLPADESADLLAAADVVVLPFRNGGGSWNSSIHAAVAQGTPVVTTTRGGAGEGEGGLVTYVAPDDLPAMRHAVDRAVERGRREPVGAQSEWDEIAGRHMDVYRAALGGRAT